LLDGRYAAAIEDLLVAYKIQPAPRLLFNVAQSYRKLGDAPRAKQYFEQYLATETEISAEKKAQVERYIAELTAQPALLASRQLLPKAATPVPYRVLRWQKVLGGLLIVSGVGLLAPGISFLAIDGRCTAEPVFPAVECDRIYSLLLPGAALTAVGGSLTIAGTLTLVIPYAKSVRRIPD
jgi:hypothetical protein